MNLRFDFEEKLQLDLLEKILILPNKELKLDIFLSKKYRLEFRITFDSWKNFPYELDIAIHGNSGPYSFQDAQIKILPFVKKVNQSHPGTIYSTTAIFIASNDQKYLNSLIKEAITQVFKIDKILNFI